MPGTARVGSQEPTFEAVGPYASSMGAYAAELFAGYGVEFQPFQRRLLDLYLARDAAGGFAAKTVAVSVPRQNGKSYAARWYAVWMAAIEGKRVLYSAHHGKTVKKMFSSIVDAVTGEPELAELLLPGRRGVRKSPGYEGVYFMGDDGRPCGMVEFQTRTNSGARGETYQVVVVDEAQELTDAQLENLKPTTLAAGRVGTADSEVQMIYIGTPPGDQCPGTVFERYHDLAHAGAPAGWWLEWAADAPPAESASFADVLDEAYAANPSMGVRIGEANMADAFGSMTRQGFARECLGWWQPREGAGKAIPAARWRECATDEPPTRGLKAFGVKFEPDGGRVALAAARRLPDGTAYVELLSVEDAETGLGSVARFLAGAAQGTARCAVDGRSGSGPLVERLRRAGWPRSKLPAVGPSEVACAASMLAAMVAEGTVSHWSDPGQAQLDVSATTCGRRRVGRDGWGFAGDSVAVEAASLALWAAVTARRDPDSSGGIGC